MYQAAVRKCFELLYGPGLTVSPVSDPLLLVSAVELAERIRKRELRVLALVTAYIQRIREVNYIINSVVDEQFEEALKIATEYDKRLDNGFQIDKEKQPLFGIPVSIKECFQLAGMRFSSGLVSRKDAIATEDALVVANLKAAGAIPIATTNLSELCMWYESSNYLYGRCRNAYDNNRIVGGSSGGEGCSLAAGASVIGLGSDIGGSIRIPAFFNGVFGHKPSNGLISNDGQFPNAEGPEEDLLTTGPMTRYAQDLPVILKTMMGSGENAIELHERLRFSQLVELRSLKVYAVLDVNFVAPLLTPLADDLKNAMKRVIEKFKEELDIEVEIINVENDLNEMRRTIDIWSVHMSQPETTLFSQLMARDAGPASGKRVRCGWELIRWVFRRSQHTLPAIGLGLFEGPARRLLKPYNERLVIRGQRLREKFLKRLDPQDGKEAVLLFPPHAICAPYHNQPLFLPNNFAYTALFNVMGFPVTQCPLGLNDDGMPLGVQVVAAPMHDRLTMAVAQQLQDWFGGWTNPAELTKPNNRWLHQRTERFHKRTRHIRMIIIFAAAIVCLIVAFICSML